MIRNHVLRAALMAGLLLVVPFGPALAVSAVEISTASGQSTPKGTFSIFRADSQTPLDTVRNDGRSQTALLVPDGGTYRVTFTPDNPGADANPASTDVTLRGDAASGLTYDPRAGTLVPAASPTDGQGLLNFARSAGRQYGRLDAQEGFFGLPPLIRRLQNDPQFARVFDNAWMEAYNYYFMRLLGPGGAGAGLGGGDAEASDIRLKENVATVENALDRIMTLRAIAYTFKNDPEKRVKYGFSAQQMLEVFPVLVHTADDDMKTLSLDYMGLIAPLTTAMQEQQALIRAQQERIEALESRLNAMETRYSASDLSLPLPVASRAREGRQME